MTCRHALAVAIVVAVVALVLAATPTNAAGGCADDLAVIPVHLQPAALDYTLVCVDELIPHPTRPGEYVAGTADLQRRVITIVDDVPPLADGWILAHEIGHLAGMDLSEAWANCYANQVLRWAPHPDCGHWPVTS